MTSIFLSSTLVTLMIGLLADFVRGMRPRHEQAAQQACCSMMRDES